jgi:predicted Zn-dependent peptidase
VVPQERLHRATLQNGLRVLVLEDHRLPRAALGVVVRRGSADLPAAQAGLASYTTELMRRGAGARDALAFAQAVDALGATLSTKAHWDSMEVSISGLSGDLDALAALLAEVVLRPRFDPEEAVRLRSQRLAALERAKDDPATLAHWHLARALFPEHPYGLPQQGTPETVTGFDAAAARATHARFFVSGDAIFYAAGDVRREDALRRARELFGAWSGEPAPAVVGALPAPPPEPSGARPGHDRAWPRGHPPHGARARRGSADERGSRGRGLLLAHHGARARGGGARLLRLFGLRHAPRRRGLPGRDGDARPGGGARRGHAARGARGGEEPPA